MVIFKSRKLGRLPMQYPNECASKEIITSSIANILGKFIQKSFSFLCVYLAHIHGFFAHQITWNPICFALQMENDRLTSLYCAQHVNLIDIVIKNWLFNACAADDDDGKRKVESEHAVCSSQVCNKYPTFSQLYPAFQVLSISVHIHLLIITDDHVEAIISVRYVRMKYSLNRGRMLNSIHVNVLLSRTLYRYIP